MPAYGNNGNSVGHGRSFGMAYPTQPPYQGASDAGVWQAGASAASSAVSNGMQGYAAPNTGASAGAVPVASNSASAPGTPAYAGTYAGASQMQQHPQYYAAADGTLYMKGLDGAFYRVAPNMTGMAVQPSGESDRKRKKRGAAFWIGIILAILCAIGAGFLLWSMLGNMPAERQGELGDLASMSDAEIQAGIDDLVAKSMFNISIASQVDFDSGTSEGEWKIENPATNSHLMTVQVVRDDTGETIYETNVIEPNHHITSDVLAVDLPAGSYGCTAKFFALDPQTEQAVGQAAAKITVNVMS